MEISQKNTEDTKVEITITLEESELETFKKTTIKRLKKDIKVPGFRDGKVPDSVAEKHVDATVLNSELLSDAVNASYGEAIVSQKIRAIGNPHIEVKKFVAGQELEYVATVDVVPPIKLADYKKFSMKADEVKVGADDVKEVLTNLSKQAADKKEVERACKEGDEVIINFSGTDTDGKPVPGAKGNNYPLTLGSQKFIPGFEDEIIGKKAGDEHEFTITFPKDYAQEQLQNAKVTFKVTIKTVNQVKPKKIDDAFAKDIGGFDTLAELKKDIKKQLTIRKKQEVDDQLKDKLLEQLVEKSKVLVPEIIIEDQVKAIRADFMNNLAYRGMTMQEYLKQSSQTEEEFEKNELRPNAERRSKSGLVLAEVAEAEDVTISEQELDMRIALLQSQHENNPQMIAQLQSDEGRKDIGSRLLTEKTIDKLVEYATK